MNDFRQYESTEAGPDGYPLAWHETLKHLAREQAGHRCVRCLHPYECGQHAGGEWTPCDERCVHHTPYRYRQADCDEWEQGWNELAGTLVAGAYQVHARWRILTVHHLDGDKLNCRWWNLAALCQRCHLNIQGRVKISRSYFLEHSEWFRPYVAGYYASSLFGVELTREQVEYRLAELLHVNQSEKRQ